MKKISEVSKLLGVTRRSLQEYDKIGLLSPSDKTEAGYWLYDFKDIDKLAKIQVLSRAGYKRKRIKELFETPNWNVYDEFENVVNILEKKKKEIDGMIRVINLIKKAHQEHPDDLDSVELLLEKICSDKSIFEYFADMAADFSEMSQEEYEVFENSSFPTCVFNICRLKGQPITERKVQESIGELFEQYLIMSGKDINEVNRKEELSTNFPEFIIAFMSDPNVEHSITSLCGDGTVEYIKGIMEELMSM